MDPQGEGEDLDRYLVRLAQVGGQWRYIGPLNWEDFVIRLRSILSEHANPTAAQSMQKYMKNSIQFYGIKSPQLKALFASFYAAHLGTLSSQAQIFMGYKLLESQFSEEKQCGIMILVKNLRSMGLGHLHDVASIIDCHVHEWATCDSLAGKVINLMMKRDNNLCEVVSHWRLSANAWRQRACCVAFVKIARFNRHNDVIITICGDCVRSPDRFVQLGVGWVLRELSLANSQLVLDFIRGNYKRFSREGLRYSIEKMDPEVRKVVLEYNKSSKTCSKPESPLTANSSSSPMSGVGSPMSPVRAPSATAAAYVPQQRIDVHQQSVAVTAGINCSASSTSQKQRMQQYPSQFISSASNSSSPQTSANLPVSSASMRVSGSGGGGIGGGFISCSQASFVTMPLPPLPFPSSLPSYHTFAPSFVGPPPVESFL